MKQLVPGIILKLNKVNVTFNFPFSHILTWSSSAFFKVSNNNVDIFFINKKYKKKGRKKKKVLVICVPSYHFMLRHFTCKNEYMKGGVMMHE